MITCFLIVLLLGLAEDDQQTDEDAHKVDEQLQRMPDVVRLPAIRALDDYLRVEDDITAEHEQPAVEEDVKDKEWTEEDVQEAQDDHHTQRRAEKPTEVEVGTTRGDYRRRGEARKDETGSQERSGDNPTQAFE